MTLFTTLRSLVAATVSMASVACSAAVPPPVARPALWQVSDADTSIYLFGTIHLLPTGYKWRTPAFDAAVGRSDSLFVETLVDQKNPAQLAFDMAQLGIRDGLAPLADRVPPAKKPALAKAIAATGYPAAAFDRMETWAAAMTLLSLQFKSMGLKGEEGVEQMLRDSFGSANKPVGELETNREQLSYFDALPEEAQRNLLESALEPEQGSKKEFNGMLASWSRGDVGAIANTFNAEVGTSPALLDALLAKRNANWTRWIEDRMTKPGTVMVAVGSGHLAGPGSVIALLERDGLTVKRLQ